MTDRKTLLLALPFAGGNSYSYNFLKLLLPDYIHLETLEYPGRGKKVKSALLTEMDVLIEDLLDQYNKIINEVKPDKVVIYGHSIGAVIGIALLHTLNEKKGILIPESGIFSGHGSPQLTTKKDLSSLPSAQLIVYFESLGCLPKEIVADAELMDYLLPILRNDLVLYENYTPAYNSKLSIPLAIINGRQDDILKEDIDNWRFETTGAVEFYELEGHHFFMSQYPAVFSALIIDLVTNGIVKTISEVYEQSAG